MNALGALLTVLDPYEWKGKLACGNLSGQLGRCQVREIVSANVVDGNYRLAAVLGHQKVGCVHIGYPRGQLKTGMLVVEHLSNSGQGGHIDRSCGPSRDPHARSGSNTFGGHAQAPCCAIPLSAAEPMPAHGANSPSVCLFTIPPPNLRCALCRPRARAGCCANLPPTSIGLCAVWFASHSGRSEPN